MLPAPTTGAVSTSQYVVRVEKCGRGEYGKPQYKCIPQVKRENSSHRQRDNGGHYNFLLGCNHVRKNKNKYVGLVDYLVLDEKSLLLLGGMLKPSVRYRGLEQR